MTPHLSTASSGELVKALADPDAWWRETAQRLLVERRDRSVVPLLRELVDRRPNALGRHHALWTLRCLDALDSGSIAAGLTDPEPRVREQAVRGSIRGDGHRPIIVPADVTGRQRCHDEWPVRMSRSRDRAWDSPRRVRPLDLAGYHDIVWLVGR